MENIVLNELGKKELREYIEEKLEMIEENIEKILLPKKILELLLFDEVNYGQGSFTKKCKAPVWTGTFLRKLDLSEINFNNVIFDLSNNEFYRDSIIDFSYTNIKIDRFISDIVNCNFTGTDLSNTTPVSINAIKSSWFKESRLNLTDCDFRDFNSSISKTSHFNRLLNEDRFEGCYFEKIRISKKDKNNDLYTLKVLNLNNFFKKMKCNLSNPDECNYIRDIIKGKLLTLPDNLYNGKKVIISKEILEKLVFDDVLYFPGSFTHDYGKKPIWFCDFMYKIDLSLVDFKNCSMIGEAANIFNVKYSNINIDCLSEVIKFCDFSYTDLSNTDTSHINSIFSCNFDNSNLKITGTISKNIQDDKRTHFKIKDSSFENCDFRELKVDLDIFVNHKSNYYIENCNFKNTGLIIKNCYIIGGMNIINELIRKGYLDGCYFENIIIDSKRNDTIEKLKNIIEEEQLTTVKNEIDDIFSKRIILKK